MSDAKEIQAQGVQVINLDSTKDAIAAFERFKKEVLRPEVDTWTDNKGKPHVRKPGWMKYAMSLGISTDFCEERSEAIKFRGQEVLVFHFTGRATAPSGRFASAVGSASSDEDKPWAATIHGIRAMAQTRAVNRAISNLVGGGEVSAEELDTRSSEQSVPPRRVVTPTTPPLQAGGNGEVPPENDIREVLEGVGLDPEGVTVEQRDWGKFEVTPASGMASDVWRKYHEALKTLGAIYHGKEDPDANLRGKWTIGA